MEIITILFLGNELRFGWHKTKQNHKLDFYYFIFTESCDPNHDKYHGSDPTDELSEKESDRKKS